MSSRVRPRYPLGLRLRTAVHRRHRLVAAALCAVAVTLVILRFAPPGAQTVSVVTAATAVPAGRALTDGDLSVREFPADLVPQGALTSPTDLVGRPATIALSPGQPLTDATVLGPGLLHGQPAGITAVSIRVSDPAVLRHVGPGDRVDVVHQPDRGESDRRTTVATGVTVLWSAPVTAGQGESLLSPAGEDADAGLVVLAAPRETASRLATLDGSGRVSLVLDAG